MPEESKYYLIYVSYARHKMADDDLLKLLEECRSNNEGNGITGMLLYIDKKFIQVIEGDKQTVVDLFDRISLDRRHKKVSIILEGELKTRNFQGWAMAFEAEDKKKVREFSAYRDFETIFGAHSLVNQNHPAFTFLKLFYEKNYKNSSVSAQAS